MSEYVYTIFISFVIGFLIGLALIELRVLFRKVFSSRKKHGFKSEDVRNLKADVSVLDGRHDHSSVDYK